MIGFIIYSVVLGIIGLLAVVVIYYNISLATNNVAPFSVSRIFPQILFPRGVVGLGMHNIE